MTSRVASAGLAAVVALAMTACGGSDKPVPLLWLSSGKMSVPALLRSDTFQVNATVNGRATSGVTVDTGAPYSLFDTGAFKGEVPEGVGTVDSLTLGNVTLLHVPTIGQAGRNIGNLVGFTAFGQFELSLNYRDRIVSLGPAPTPDGLETDGTSLPVTLEGGDYGRVIADGPPIPIPASRVVIPVQVEGEEHDVLIDSGSSFVGLRKSVFDRLGADGRGKLEEHVQLASSVSTTSVMRLRSVVVAGTEVLDANAASSVGNPGSGIPGLEDLLDSLSNEVGRSVDGLLGGVVLREFFVTLGYPEGRLSFTRYTTRDHIHDQYKRVGIQLTVSSEKPPFSYVVGKIYAGTDAARQLDARLIRVGADVLSIDDQPLPDDDPEAADTMLLGTVGNTHRVAFAKVTLELLVEDLIPLP